MSEEGGRQEQKGTGTMVLSRHGLFFFSWILKLETARDVHLHTVGNSYRKVNLLACPRVCICEQTCRHAARYKTLTCICMYPYSFTKHYSRIILFYIVRISGSAVGEPVEDLSRTCQGLSSSPPTHSSHRHDGTIVTGAKPEAAPGDLQIDCKTSNKPSCLSTHPGHFM